MSASYYLKDYVGYGIAAALCLLAYAVCVAMADNSCSKRWAAAGREAKWQPGHGCLVKQADGMWRREPAASGARP